MYMYACVCTLLHIHIYIYIYIYIYICIHVYTHTHVYSQLRNTAVKPRVVCLNKHCFRIRLYTLWGTSLLLFTSLRAGSTNISWLHTTWVSFWRVPFTDVHRTGGTTCLAHVFFTSSKQCSKLSYGQFSHQELSDQESLSQHSEITALRN